METRPVVRVYGDISQKREGNADGELRGSDARRAVLARIIKDNTIALEQESSIVALAESAFPSDPR